MTGHIVGLDPMTDRIVVLRKGMDGKAVRQVDVLTIDEARTLHHAIRVAIEVATTGHPVHERDRGMVPRIDATPEPTQVSFDLDTLNDQE